MDDLDLTVQSKLIFNSPLNISWNMILYQFISTLDSRVKASLSHSISTEVNVKQGRELTGDLMSSQHTSWHTCSGSGEVTHSSLTQVCRPTHGREEET